jgi:Ca2+-binding EF-hand superfamily protein
MKTNGIFGIGVMTLALMAAVPGVGRAQDNRDLDLASIPSPMQALRNLQNTGRILFVMADVNHDGQLSLKEATDANNLLVGGFFFEADLDGNGVVSQEEARSVRDSYLNQNPWAKYVVESLDAQAKQQKNQNSNQVNPLLSLNALLDSNGDKQIQAKELRQLVATVTQSVFASADTNRDGQMSPSEVNAAVAGAFRTMGQFAFQQADTDGNGSLSRAEYDKAIVEPANVVFQILDLNHDGQISMQESQQTERALISQFRMLQLPEPANSPTNLIKTGKLPSEASQVPTFATPATGGNNPNENNNNRTQPVAPPAQPSAPR